MEPIYYLTIQGKTVFIPLKALYAECAILRADHPSTDGLQCLIDECPANRDCMTTLAHRVHYFLDKVAPECELILAYFKVRSGSIKAGIFTRDFSEPRVITCNRSAFAKFQKQGTVFMWTPDPEFYLIRGNSDLILPTSLIRGT